MKKITGVPLLDINNPIIGKITYKPIKHSLRQDFVFVANGEKLESGYAAILVIKRHHDLKGTTILCNPEDIKYLNTGDVVSIEPNGNINVLYKKNSVGNVLLVTERCNCSCIMCPQSLVTKEDDKSPFIFKIISLIDNNTQLLGITGGEPTLIGDKLIDIITACKQRLPKTKLIMLTNGIKLENFDYVKKIVMVQHPDLTIDIPLYADTDTEHNNIIRANGFYKTIQGLYNLARFKQKIGIRIVIHKLNYKRLPQLAEFIYHNFPFVFHVAFMQMETMEIAKKNIDILWIDPYDYNEQLEKAVTYLWKRGMNVSIYNAQLCVLPKNLWRYSRKSISSWKNIYLEECGKCDYLENCGGFFASSLELHSQHIKIIKKN